MLYLIKALFLFSFFFTVAPTVKYKADWNLKKIYNCHPDSKSEGVERVLLLVQMCTHLLQPYQSWYIKRL